MNYVGVFSLYRLNHQAEAFDFSAMFGAGGHDIDAGGVDAAVAEEVGQLGDVLFDGVEGFGEEFSQIVGEYLWRMHSRRFAQPFHLRPDGFPVQRFSVPCEKNHAGTDFLFFGVAQEVFSQFDREEDGSCFGFAAYGDFSSDDGLDGEKAQFRYADAGGAKGLHHQAKGFLFLCGFEEALIFGFAQLLFCGAVGAFLGFQGFNSTVGFADIHKEAVDGGQHGIDRGHGIAFGQQVIFVFHHGGLCDGIFPDMAGKSADVSKVLFYGGGRFFFLQKVVMK